MGLPAGFGRMIRVEEFASGFYFPPLGDGLAARDGEEPGAEAAAFFEGVEFPKSEEEGFLGEVFGIFAASGEFVEEGVDFFVMPMNNLIRRRKVAPASGEDEIGIGEINHWIRGKDYLIFQRMARASSTGMVKCMETWFPVTDDPCSMLSSSRSGSAIIPKATRPSAIFWRRAAAFSSLVEITKSARRRLSTSVREALRDLAFLSILEPLSTGISSASILAVPIMTELPGMFLADSR